MPDWLPPAGFWNRRIDIECLKSSIAALNKGKGIFLTLHMEGVRMDKKTAKKMHKHNPARLIWMELEIRRWLHFTPDHKIRIVMLAMKLFWGRLTMLGNW